MPLDHFWTLLSKKIAGEASAEELIQFEKLLADHPQLSNSAEMFSILWQQSLPPDKNECLQAFDYHLGRMKKAGIQMEEHSHEENPRRRFSIRKWLLPLSAAAAAILIFLFFWQSTASGTTEITLPSEVITKAGSKTQVQLPDGSKVWLNASSKLIYNENFGKHLREVTLTGEAFFDVVKDAAHPFIIHTKVVDVKVLGTQFNVKAYPNDRTTETSLIKGSVEITVKNRNNDKHFLKPNEKMIVNNFIPDPVTKKPAEIKRLYAIERLTYDVKDSTIIETGWVDNKLIFQQNETFIEAAPKMERWFGVNIKFNSEKVANYRPFVTFTNETITEALDALKEGFKFNYKIVGNEITITQ